MVFRSGDSFDCALRARRQPSPRCRSCGCTGDYTNYAINCAINCAINYASYINCANCAVNYINYAVNYAINYAINRGFRGPKPGRRGVG